MGLCILALLLVGCVPKDEGIGLKITYLDEEGNVVKTERLLRPDMLQTVYQGRHILDKSYPSAIITLTITNTGNVPLNITLNEVSFIGDYTE